MQQVSQVSQVSRGQQEVQEGTVIWDHRGRQGLKETKGLRGRGVKEADQRSVRVEHQGHQDTEEKMVKLVLKEQKGRKESLDSQLKK